MSISDIRIVSGADARATFGIDARATFGIDARATSGTDVRATFGIDARATSGTDVRVTSSADARRLDEFMCRCLTSQLIYDANFFENSALVLKNQRFFSIKDCLKVGFVIQ